VEHPPNSKTADTSNRSPRSSIKVKFFGMMNPFLFLVLLW
jgi:hypothetical protein